MHVHLVVAAVLQKWTSSFLTGSALTPYFYSRKFLALDEAGLENCVCALNILLQRPEVFSLEVILSSHRCTLSYVGLINRKSILAAFVSSCSGLSCNVLQV